jgi:hypothetical protein
MRKENRSSLRAARLGGPRKKMADVINPPTQPPALPSQMSVASRKVLMRTSEEPPVFINAAEFAAMGMDVFMDVGVTPVESVNAAIQLYKDHPNEPPPVDFHVSFRFGMSIQTAMLIHQRLTQLLQQSVVQTAALLEQAKLSAENKQS